MVDTVRRWWPLALIALAALWLRTHDLAARPMHADEANQAVKLGELLEHGRYAFDPRDHHGPTLYYAAAPVAWLRGQPTLAQLTETTVRIVPAVFGTAIVILIGLLASPLGRWPAFAAAAFLAVSPPAVYYARYFIQETLLSAFTLAAVVCAREAWRRRCLGWAIVTGVFVGLMQATKATAPLFVFAVAFALFATRQARLPADAAPSGAAGRWRAQLHVFAALVAAVVTAALLYSSFGTNFSGLRDALATYTQTGDRLSSGTGHEKAWWYYLQLFGWQRTGGLLWHQAPFTALAAVGFGTVVVASGRSLLARDHHRASPASRFLTAVAVYTLIVAGAFSVLAYKTPWHAVHFVPGLALLAAGALVALTRLNTGKFVALAAALLVIATLYQQTNRVAFLRPADGRNPFAYVHTSVDIRKFRPLAEAALAQFPDRPIRVIAEEYWPLPWYFRGLPRVGYWTTPPAECDGALVIASASHAEAVRARLRGNYRQTFVGLRPGVVLIVFIAEP